MLPRLALPFILLGGCAPHRHHHQHREPAAPPPPATVEIAPPALVPTATPTPAGYRPATGKKVVDQVDDLVLVGPDVPSGGIDTCEVRDIKTNELRGSVSTRDTAAGGTNVECVGLAMQGRVVIMSNSRGRYAKETKTGRALPCAEAFSEDLKTCLQLDTSPQVYIGNSPGAAASDFQIQICATEHVRCTTLFTVPRGLNRWAGTRDWDGAYCSKDRVVILADGVLHTFDARFRRELSKEAAPSKTRVTCVDGKVATQ